MSSSAGQPPSSTHEAEVAGGRRFEFGQNWQAFARTLGEGQSVEAERSLRSMLATNELAAKSFLGAGCGIGLSSLAARRLGARVRSFDFGPLSVECARALKERFFPGDPLWTIAEGSILDRDCLASLERFDVVY